MLMLNCICSAYISINTCQQYCVTHLNTSPEVVIDVAYCSTFQILAIKLHLSTSWVYSRTLLVSVAELWRWEMKSIDCVLTVPNSDPKQCCDAKAWPWNGISWCLPSLRSFIQTLTPSALLPGDWEITKGWLHWSSRVSVMFYGCQNDYRTTSMQLVGIQLCPQRFLSKSDTCHNRNSSSWRVVCLHLQHTRLT